ncbi:hypothetical protein DWU98_18710 [Dyella monticola]|uniref:Uncharacterized protein n=1 Tax=Dyella monticola TaxID=1927958 RepID=A0A370WT47_9GAMM|nr:hypothetical protein DWU98_18710 [Dyella monticola]
MRKRVFSLQHFPLPAGERARVRGPSRGMFVQQKTKRPADSNMAYGKRDPSPQPSPRRGEGANANLS